MSNTILDISNLSYTNKDFSAIFSEMLELVKKLTLKWDPSISNESDPGVILLKLSALLADKLNYNIDKNILEAFPSSVSQTKNAWALYKQLGYFMHWYQAGTTTLSAKWINEDSYTTNNVTSVTIPKFTLVTNSENSIYYTTIEEAKIYTSIDSADKTFIKAIQGSPIEYNINGNTLITYQNLDSNKRIYFEDVNVAENGIFITSSSDASAEWKK